MTPSSWFLILFSFGILGIALFLIRAYALKYNDIKVKVHAIHSMIEIIDESIKDDSVTKEEFTAIIKTCLEVLRKLL